LSEALPIAEPHEGDALVTSEGERHYLSVIPSPHRMSFKELSHAVDMAKRWAERNGANAWQKVQDQITKIPNG
jgi:hypothetical protein